MNEDRIEMVPVDQIHVMNPRSREAKRYRTITKSITTLGLKIPIVVSPRSKSKKASEIEYDLVCGQGRLEAFRAAGESKIPARIIDASESDILLMSLVENMARRKIVRSELVSEIVRLQQEGYSVNQISEKIDCGYDFVKGVLKLHSNGEDRLLDAVMNEKISVAMANMIAEATSNAEAQDAIMQAYENKEIQLRGLGSVKRLLDQREYLGKNYSTLSSSRPRVTSREKIVAAYQREIGKQKNLVKKARICEVRLLFLKQAFRRLSKDENFKTLLRAERIESMPEYLRKTIDDENEES